MTLPKLVACLASIALAALLSAAPASTQDEETETNPCLEACWTIAQGCYESCDSEGETQACEDACDGELESCELACE